MAVVPVSRRSVSREAGLRVAAVVVGRDLRFLPRGFVGGTRT